MRSQVVDFSHGLRGKCWEYNLGPKVLVRKGRLLSIPFLFLLEWASLLKWLGRIRLPVFKSCHSPCDLEHIVWPFYVSISSSVRGGQYGIYFTEDVRNTYKVLAQYIRSKLSVEVIQWHYYYFSDYVEEKSYNSAIEIILYSNLLLYACLLWVEG